MNEPNEVDQLPDLKKITIIMDSGLDRGLASNRAAVLATGLTNRHPEIIGSDLRTQDDHVLPGFTRVPIVLLDANGESLRDLARKARELGCEAFVFLARAQGMRSYSEYVSSVAGTRLDELDVDALLVYGARKAVNRVGGSLPSLK